MKPDTEEMTKARPTVLVVEDEQSLADIVRDYLQAADFEVHHLAEGSGVAAWIKENQPAAVLLDLMLPGRDGLDICRDVRGFSDVPIIMVTARVDEIDRLLGLELGADDYVCKPFSPRELVARVRALLRRVGVHSVGTSMPVPEGIGLDTDAYMATLDGQALDLTRVEFRLLALLAGSKGRPVRRDDLLDGLYDDHRIVTPRTVDTHVKNLRRKLAAVRPDEEIIQSVYGIGYRLRR